MTKTLRFLVTGAAGFIGSAVARHLIESTGHFVCALDKLTYAGNLANLAPVISNSRFLFEKADICDTEAISQIFDSFRPDIVMHLAAESHVDRSIDGPAQFIQTNIVGTYVLLEVARQHWEKLDNSARQRFRFHHISTDEVFGSLEDESLFSESSPYCPRSPYSASKASADHLVRAWHYTFGLPTVLSNCSNNYGPYQFPEKLIPLAILNALVGKQIPVYGNGKNVRDWLYIEDHARALVLIAQSGAIGESYNIGGMNQMTNIDVIQELCTLVDETSPDATIGPRADLITFVTDRPGHDRRYAIDTSKIERELGWKPLETFQTGLRKTVRWYLDNRGWWESIRTGSYAGERLGQIGSRAR